MHPDAGDIHRKLVTKEMINMRENHRCRAIAMLFEGPGPWFTRPGEHMRIVGPVDFEIPDWPSAALVVAGRFDNAGVVEDISICDLVSRRPDAAAKFRKQDHAQIFIFERQRFIANQHRLAA